MRLSNARHVFYELTLIVSVCAVLIYVYVQQHIRPATPAPATPATMASSAATTTFTTIVRAFVSEVTPGPHTSGEWEGAQRGVRGTRDHRSATVCMYVLPLPLPFCVLCMSLLCCVRVHLCTSFLHLQRGMTQAIF